MEQWLDFAKQDNSGLKANILEFFSAFESRDL
jgi:hypothetical protein